MNRSSCLVLAVLVMGCSREQDAQSRSAESSRIALAGRYQTDSLSGEIAGRVVTLELKGDSDAVLTTVLPGQAAVVRQGHYSADAAALQATFPLAADAAAATFRWRLISGRLVPVDWDRTQYGLAGLTLHPR